MQPMGTYYTSFMIKLNGSPLNLCQVNKLFVWLSDLYLSAGDSAVSWKNCCLCLAFDLGNQAWVEPVRIILGDPYLVSKVSRKSALPFAPDIPIKRTRFHNITSCKLKTEKPWEEPLCPFKNQLARFTGGTGCSKNVQDISACVRFFSSCY